MDISEFDYCLPKDLIAQEPVSPRDAARLMVLDGDKVEHRFFRDIIHYFSDGDILVLNNTKVLPAKLIGKKETGGKVEFLVLKRDGNVFECLVRGSRVKDGNIIVFENDVSARVLAISGGRCTLEFHNDADKVVGLMPLPPYIKMHLKDSDRYQTVYANEDGSVAAPTAGLHFTDELLEDIRRKGVKTIHLTLHIGPGTFLPVKGNDVSAHRMEEEYYRVDEQAAELLNTAEEEGRRLFVTGTSSVRALESAFGNCGIIAGEGWTSLYIYPGYKFKNKIHALITNFHLPKSTVLLLTSAFAGKGRLFKAYEGAVKLKYRFYSFGDAMLIRNAKQGGLHEAMRR